MIFRWHSNLRLLQILPKRSERMEKKRTHTKIQCELNSKKCSTQKKSNEIIERSLSLFLFLLLIDSIYFTLTAITNERSIMRLANFYFILCFISRFKKLRMWNQFIFFSSTRIIVVSQRFKFWTLNNLIVDFYCRIWLQTTWPLTFNDNLIFGPKNYVENPQNLKIREINWNSCEKACAFADAMEKNRSKIQTWISNSIHYVIEKQRRKKSSFCEPLDIKKKHPIDTMLVLVMK